MKKILTFILVFSMACTPAAVLAISATDVATAISVLNGTWLLEKSADLTTKVAIEAWLIGARKIVSDEKLALSASKPAYDYCAGQTHVCALGYCVDRADVIPGCTGLVVAHIGLKKKIEIDEGVINFVASKTGALDLAKSSTSTGDTKPKKPTEPLTAGSEITLNDPLQGKTILTLIQQLVGVVIPMSGAIALLVFIYGGVMWMTAGGSNRVDEAKKIIEYGSIGLVIILLAYTLSSTFIKLIAG